jgi:hypothetical protein
MDTATEKPNQDPPNDSPLVTFYRFIPECRVPQRADSSAAGTLPTRAFRYCEAVRVASAFGWYLFPPIGVGFQWDGGTDISWTYAGADDWYPLKTAQFPGFVEHFDERAPDEIKGFSPPFVAALQEPGVVQIWSGIVARTAPGWSLLVRAPANLPRSLGYDVYEGIIETDRWFRSSSIPNCRCCRSSRSTARFMGMHSNSSSSSPNSISCGPKSGRPITPPWSARIPIRTGSRVSTLSPRDGAAAAKTKKTKRTSRYNLPDCASFVFGRPDPIDCCASQRLVANRQAN